VKFLVLGANGRTGRFIVNQGLARGHQIVGLIRNPDSLQAREGLTIIKGTPTDAESLAAAATDCDAILVALNNPRTSDAPWAKPLTTEKVLTKVAQNIVTLGDKRVIALSAAGVGDSFDSSPWLMRFMIKRTNLSYAYGDHNSVEEVFRSSSARWTLVRAVGLSDSNKEKKLYVKTPNNPKPGMMIRRSPLADFMLDCAENTLYVPETPPLSEK